MTPIYEAKSKHTKEMLKHFISLTYEIKNPNTVQHVSVLSFCWYLLAYIAREDLSLLIAFVAFGTIGFLFLLVRKSLGVASLAKQDEVYKQDGEVEVIFGHKGFEVESSVTQESKLLSYNEVTSLYKDRLYYYLGINNDSMQIIDRRYLTGDQEAYEQFVEGKVGRTFYEVNLPFVQEMKRRWVRFRYNFQMKKLEAQEQQDEREARIQENKRNKKNKKKK